MKAPALWTTFTDTKGQNYSFARMACAVLVASAVFWGTIIVLAKFAIPDFTSLAALILAVYGANRAAEAYENRPAAPPAPPILPTQTVNIGKPENPDA